MARASLQQRQKTVSHMSKRKSMRMERQLTCIAASTSFLPRGRHKHLKLVGMTADRAIFQQPSAHMSAPVLLVGIFFSYQETLVPWCCLRSLFGVEVACLFHLFQAEPLLTQLEESSPDNSPLFAIVVFVIVVFSLFFIWRDLSLIIHGSRLLSHPSCLRSFRDLSCCGDHRHRVLHESVSTPADRMFATTHSRAEQYRRENEMIKIITRDGRMQLVAATTYRCNKHLRRWGEAAGVHLCKSPRRVLRLALVVS